MLLPHGNICGFHHFQDFIQQLLGYSIELISLVLLRFHKHYINLQFIHQGHFPKMVKPMPALVNHLVFLDNPVEHACRVCPQVNHTCLLLQRQVDAPQNCIKLSQIYMSVFVQQSQPACILSNGSTILNDNTSGKRACIHQSIRDGSV